MITSRAHEIILRAIKSRPYIVDVHFISFDFNWNKTEKNVRTPLKDFPDKIQLLILFCLYFKVYLKSAKKEQMRTNLSTMVSKQRSYNSWPDTYK